MNARKWLITGGTVTLVALAMLALAVGLTQAQGPGPEGNNNESSIAETAADVYSRIPIQGRLTDANGTPLSGTYSIAFRIYDASIGGNQTCHDTNDVQVNNGLFYTEIWGDCGPDDFNGRQLYLGIEVEGDGEMTNRQPISPVPYAMSLRPGARISDTRDTILTVRSTGSGDADAIKAYGGGTGEAMEAFAVDGVGLFAVSENYLALQAYSYSTDTHPAIFGCSAESNSPCDPLRNDGAVGVLGFGGDTTSIGVAGLQSGYNLADLGMWSHPGGFFGGLNGVIGIGNTGVLGLTDNSDGWSGMFTGNGNGVRISTPDTKVGLEVIGGSKNAVVGTDDGARLLYTEESTEVWFTDYGFGELQDGVAIIPIDPVFAQTVNLEEPYHVFVQVYGNAEVYVTNRTPTQFEVRLRDGEPNTDFSYRIVGKRLGYEADRLERAPWADDDPNLYPITSDSP